jgi:hypothetical protein
MSILGIFDDHSVGADFDFLDSPLAAASNEFQKWEIVVARHVHQCGLSLSRLIVLDHFSYVAQDAGKLCRTDAHAEFLEESLASVFDGRFGMSQYPIIQPGTPLAVSGWSMARTSLSGPGDSSNC